MIKQLFTPKLLLAIGIIFAGAVTRLLPHYPNFTAVGAIALFSGAYLFNNRWAFAIPLATMLLTDLVLGWHATIIPVYVSFVIIVALGITLRGKKTPGKLALLSFASSVVFFVITNTGFWLTGLMYPLTPAGLAACFTAALPFFQNNVLGDLVYTGLFFTVYELALQKMNAPAEARV